MPEVGCFLRGFRRPEEARREDAGRHGGDLRQEPSVPGLDVGVNDVEEKRSPPRLSGRCPRPQLSGKVVIFKGIYSSDKQ